jgi:integrase
MRGTIVKYEPKTGRPTFGFYFVAGRDENGKRIQIKKRGFEKKTDAEKALQKAIAEYESKPAAKQKVPTFAEFFARWDEECFSRTCAPKTVERYRELGEYAIKLFGDVPIDQLETMRLAVALNQLADHGGRSTKTHPKGRPLAPKTVRHIGFLVQGCLNQAVDWDLIPKNPMVKVKKPKVPRRRPAIVSTSGSAGLFARIAGQKIYPLVLVYYSTGMRRGELLALEWTDIDWSAGMLEISKSLEQTKRGLRIKGTKSGETRRIALSEAVLEALREHQRAQRQERELFGSDYRDLGLIFARPDGYYYSPDKMGTRIRAAMVAAGLENVSLHSLRHTHASELLSKGAPIPAVAERLGHASANVTLGIYSHALPADNRAVAKLWNDALVDVLEEGRKTAACGNLPKSTTGRGEKKVIPIKSAS